ncbi:MAG: hypothetical protein ACK41Z_05220 [Sediminibacterium sp.]
MVRHVLSADYGWNIIIKTGGDLCNYKSPWDGRPFSSVKDEIDFAQLHHQEFLLGFPTCAKPFPLQAI